MEKERILFEPFVIIERMSEEEYKNGGAALSIYYCFMESPFGKMIVASTSKGVCYMAFVDDEAEALATLQKKFPRAAYHRQAQHNILRKIGLFFTQSGRKPEAITLHLKGTDFQLDVWKALLKIPMGSFSTYKEIAAAVNNPYASRAVGTAVGDNPIVFLIPCHRVICTSGKLGGYHWGVERKAAIIKWERVEG
jgi:AraC family transcriptional regulator of adaptative response/methylated-DNA-[protein]-cysteine methyltransferase